MTTICDEGGNPVMHTTATACVKALLASVIDLATVPSETLTNLMGVLETEYINRLAQTYRNDGEADFVG